VFGGSTDQTVSYTDLSCLGSCEKTLYRLGGKHPADFLVWLPCDRQLVRGDEVSRRYTPRSCVCHDTLWGDNALLRTDGEENHCFWLSSSVQPTNWLSSRNFVRTWIWYPLWIFCNVIKYAFHLVIINPMVQIMTLILAHYNNHRYVLTINLDGNI
jgi:hypothetical protein